MSAYISDGTLYLCQSLLDSLNNLVQRIGAERSAELLRAIDEIDAGISGITIEQARDYRVEMERIKNKPGDI